MTGSELCRRGIVGMGVADGVYQWREQGIDAGEYSRLLMHTALEAVEEGQPDVLKGQNLASVLGSSLRLLLLTHSAGGQCCACLPCPTRTYPGSIDAAQAPCTSNQDSVD